MTTIPSFTGRVALVTGASRGIGRAIAMALAEAGANVAVNYRERADDAAEVVKIITGIGGRAIAVRADVSVSADVAAMTALVVKQLGPVDILVNNAGIGLQRGIEDLTEEDFERTLRVNLTSAFLCSQAVLPHMRAQKWGRIVNITSGAARGPGGLGVHYNAAKAGMEGLTRGYAARLATEGVTVNAVAPSLIETDMIDAIRPEHLARIPMQRRGRPEEVALGVLLVAGNGYMTGQTVQINGGTNFV